MIERRLVSRPVSTIGTLIAPRVTQQEGPPIVTQGLVGHWDAGNPYSYPATGTTWTDLSGNGNNGTLINGPTFSADRGGGIVFDGTNQYVNFGASSSLNTTTSATIGAMVRFNANYGGLLPYQELLTKRVADPTNASNYGINFNGRSTINEMQLYYTAGGNYRILKATLNTNFPTDQWQYIVGVLEKSSTSTILSLYKNADLVTSGTFAGNLETNAASLMFGAYTGTINSFAGRASVLQIYTRALSAGEIFQNFQATRWRFGI